MSFVPNDSKPQKCKGCTKTVYPNEAIKAIDAYWHKVCLKCTSCGITLNIKTVESFNKEPYCRTHLPKASHTQVADSVATVQATSAPKVSKTAGVKVDERRTFAPGSMGPIRGRGGARGAPASAGSPSRGGSAAASAPAPSASAAAAAPRPAPSAGAAPRGVSSARGGVTLGAGGNKCAGCGKTVYSNEQLKAVNAIWHPVCLKCTVCSVTLNLKTVESFEKKPYCRSHLPKASHTQVTDSVATRQALQAPKAVRMEGQIKQDARRTFAPGAAGPIRGARGGARGGAAAAAPRESHASSHTTAKVAAGAAVGGAAAGAVAVGGAVVATKAVEDWDSSAKSEYTSAEPERHQEDYGYSDDYEESASTAVSQVAVSAPAESYDEGGYEEGGYEEGGYEEGGYEEGGYEEAAAPAEAGYEEGGYAEGEGYEEGYAEGEGYDEGYAEGEGYDEGYGY